MKKRNFLLLALMGTMLMGVYAEAASPGDFSDFPTGWSKAAMTKAVENGLIFGSDGKINPDDYMTRAEMASIMSRAFASNEKTELSAYVDVDSSAWYYDELAKAVNMGIFVGDGEKLNPNKNITREEAFCVVARAFDIEDEGLEEANVFYDKNDISFWAKKVFQHWSKTDILMDLMAE